MKRVLFVLLAVMLACAFALAQETPPPAGTGSTQQPVPQNPQTPSPSPSAAQPSPGATPNQPSTPGAAASNAKISPGSVIPALLAKTVDAKKAKKGDEVVAKVPQDLPSTSGQILVPKDSKVAGHVTEVQPRSKEQKESQLAISFDKLEMKNGEQMQLPMSIQAVIAPPNRNANENQAGSQGGANEPAGASPSGGTGAPTGAGARGGMAGSNPSQASAPENAGNAPSEQKNGGAARPQITGETKGVVGIPNLSLAAAPDPTQGSVMTSEKNNVKLEDGTFLLLRVSPAGAQTPAPQSSPMPQQ
jgi:hypothetical protein